MQHIETLHIPLWIHPCEIGFCWKQIHAWIIAKRDDLCTRFMHE
jgi:hypothetical protein